MGHTVKLLFDDARTLVIETSKGDIARLEDEVGQSWQAMELGESRTLRLCYFACMRLARRNKLDAEVPADYEQFRDLVLDYEVIPPADAGKANSAPDQPTG